MVIWVVLEVNTADGYEGQGGDISITFFSFLYLFFKKRIKNHSGVETSDCDQRKVMKHNVHSGRERVTEKCGNNNLMRTPFDASLFLFAEQITARELSAPILGQSQRTFLHSCVFILNRIILHNDSCPVIRSPMVVYRIPAEAGIPCSLWASWGYFSWTSSCVRVASA